MIAGVLQLVGQGSTYVEASRWARRQTPGAGKSKDNGLAIGLVEAFSHTVWDPLAAQLVETERARRDARRAGADVPPAILAVDDASFPGRDGTVFHCLVGADVPTDGSGDVALRFVRAFASKDTTAWAVALSELGAPPDYVIADGASAIAAAMPVAFPDAEDDEVTYLPSLWHIRRNLTEAFFYERSGTADRAAGRRKNPPLPHPVAMHLDRLARRDGALASPSAFDTWWADLEALYAAWSVPADVITNQRASHHDRIAAVAERLADNDELPASTGAVEGLIEYKVKPFFHNRAHSFGNLERTNRALNLAVAWHRGHLDDIDAITRAITDDVAAHDARAAAQRSADDTYYADASGIVRYSSLRDPTLIAQIARQRGLR